MYTLIVYGSLLNPNELKKHNIDISRVEMVKVKGYRRVFNQLPSWRKVSGIKKGVMNIVKESDLWFNALAIKNLKQDYIFDLDIRERGYNRVSLSSKDVVTYKGENMPNCVVYIGKTGLQSKDILPNPEYFSICLNGAKEFGNIFFNDYKNTTFQNDLKGGFLSISMLL